MSIWCAGDSPETWSGRSHGSRARRGATDRTYGDGYEPRPIPPAEDPPLLQDHAQFVRSDSDNRRADVPSAAREACDTLSHRHRDRRSLDLEARVPETERVRPSMSCA